MNACSRIFSLCLCVMCSACVPFKFASRLDGVVIDSKSSMPIPGATLVSRIPHKDGTIDAVDVTDGEGRFSLPQESGITLTLTLAIDMREIVITKKDYEPMVVSVVNRRSERWVSGKDRLLKMDSLRNDPFRIKLKKKN